MSKWSTRLGVLSPLLLVLALWSSPAPGQNTHASELAATGKLRFGLVEAPKANMFFVLKGGDGSVQGVTAELAAELARTIGVPIEFLVAHNSGELTDALEKGEIDAAFLPVDEERKKRVQFGPAYVFFESTCLVLGNSPFHSVSDLDRPGVRVAGEANTTTIRAAARVLQRATMVPSTSVAEAIEKLRKGEVDAFALAREALLPYLREIPGSRLLEGHIHRTGIAIALPKDRPAALGQARAFIEQAKASGLIRRTFDKAGLESIPVAPAE